MIEAFQKLLSRRKLSIAHEVTPERISIADRIRRLVERLKERRSMRFDELFDERRQHLTSWWSPSSRCWR
jgi:chromatin segregation and condensation protein Rec8/ScpA/Scc1 (kleisin family)